HTRVRGEAKIVVRADHQHRASSYRHFGAFGAVQRHKIRIQPALFHFPRPPEPLVAVNLIENIHLPLSRMYPRCGLYVGPDLASTKQPLVWRAVVDRRVSLSALYESVVCSFDIVYARAYYLLGRGIFSLLARISMSTRFT